MILELYYNMSDNKFILDLHDLKPEKIDYNREIKKPKKLSTRKKKKTINKNDSHTLYCNNPAIVDTSLFRYETGKPYQLTIR